ncbi:RNA polymerase III C11 subunit [Basidiobolus ranarum]|uniref:DNA-directed RNA polymerase subunit n=1 Tax=Basidiobolus ranarum TaxID=34480 RepID=A0ABR2VZ56_9FUNG
MLFCPSCSNLLLISNDTGSNHFYCQTCPYMFPVTRTHATRNVLKRKEVDDVLGGAKAWANVDSIEATCPKCEHLRAYFLQIQIRSADEPMSTFYKCCNHECQYQWKEK